MAFKMARLYHVHRGKPQKQLIISRWRGYHGRDVGHRHPATQSFSFLAGRLSPHRSLLSLSL